MKSITNVNFIATREPKGLKLAKPCVLFHAEGPILTVLFEKDKGYGDLYLHTQIFDNGDYLFVKIDHLKLLEYLNNKIALQEVIYSCKESYFIYQLIANKKSTHIEMPVEMLSSYRLTYAENRISQLSKSVKQSNGIQSLTDNLNEWIDSDPFMEEDWFEDEQENQFVSIDASIYF